MKFIVKKGFRSTEYLNFQDAVFNCAGGMEGVEVKLSGPEYNELISEIKNLEDKIANELRDKKYQISILENKIGSLEVELEGKEKQVYCLYQAICRLKRKLAKCKDTDNVIKESFDGRKATITMTTSVPDTLPVHQAWEILEKVAPWGAELIRIEKSQKNNCWLAVLEKDRYYYENHERIYIDRDEEEQEQE